MVELTAGEYSLELASKVAPVKYTRQIADVFDIANVANSFTTPTGIPKTPNNTYALQQLGIVGDSSNSPYEKIPSTLKNHGFSLIQSGWLSVKETSNEYKISVLDGMIDFFKEIENKTMGVDLDLTNFNHTKDIDSVVASFTNDFYKYLVADYNGKVEAEFSGLVGINIDYLAPGFSMRKLLDLVMATFGYTFDMANLESINDKYITYPKAPAETVTDDLVATLNKGLFVKPPQNIGGGLVSVPSEYFWDSETIVEGSLLNDWRYVIPESTGYKITISTEMYARYQSFSSEAYLPMTVQVIKNGTTLISIQSNPYDAVVSETSVYATIGDIIEVKYFRQSGIVDGRTLTEIHHNSTELKVFKTNQGEVSLTEAFKDFQIKDFFKDILWRTSTTPIINPTTKHINFVTVSERLDFANSKDWSDKFIVRKKEVYINGSFSQKNILRHKHNDENDQSYDGYMYVNNKNIDAERVLIESKYYAPENVITTFKNIAETQNVKTKKFTIWERDVKESADGVVEVDYKGLNNRFYVLSLRQSPESSWRLVSEEVAGSTTVTGFPYADTEGTTFDQIVEDKYADYNSILNNFRAHDIELALGLEDFLSMDLTVPYYFEQEAGYYIVNKISYQDGQESLAECVRINKR